MSFVTELYRVKLIISVVALVNFLSVLIISYILFSPKTFFNLPKTSSSKLNDETYSKLTAYQKCNILIEDDEEDEEEEDIEIYGPSHLLLNSSNQRT